MKKLSTVAVLLLAALLVVGAFRTVLAANSALAGTRWVLSSLNGQLPLPGDGITLEFGADGNASGSDGCNRYSVPYTVKGSSLTFGASTGVTTLMACPEVVMTQATAYMDMLASVDKFDARGNQLTLVSGAKIVATFVAAGQDLAGTSWTVTAYNNGKEAVTSPIEGADLTMNFDDDNRVAGNSGCNDFFASYLTSGDAILIGSIGSTRRFCEEPAGVMEQEAQFQAALQSATTYSVSGNRLELRNGADAIAVQAVRELTVAVPEPDPGEPTGRVTAPNGVNVRSGPGTNFPILGVAPFGTEGEIIGRSANSQWWAVAVPAAPGGMGWVSADFVAVTNAEDVPIIASPPPPVFVPAPTPIPTPTRIPAPTATPAPQMSFTANPTTINQGQCSTLQWSVENVQAVWVYPQGQPYQQFPQVGQGSQQVCPPTTTTYEMRVLLRDGSVVTQRVTVTVIAAAPTNPLAGTNWAVTGYYIGGAVASPIVGTNLTTRFDSGSQLSGQAGCNTYTGGYSVSGSNISIGQLGTGMSMCDTPPGVMEQEQSFISALQSSSTFRFDGNRLELRRWDGTITVMYTRLQ